MSETLDGSDAFGAESLGAIEAALAAGSVPRTRLTFYRRRIRAMFRRWGETVEMESREKTRRVSLRIGLRTLNPAVEIVGELKLSDYSVILPGEALRLAGFAEPLRRGEILYRYPSTPRETMMRIIDQPQALTLADEILLYRATARG